MPCVAKVWIAILHNRKQMKLTNFAGVVALLGAASSAQATNLVTNGSFENTTLTHSDFLGNTATGWSTNSYTFLVFAGTAQGNIGNGVKLYLGVNNIMPASSPDGGKFVAADSDYGTGVITQNINGLVVGATYALSFYQAAAQQQGYSGATSDRFQVSLGAQTQLSDVMSNPSQDFTPWAKQTLNFTATSVSELLSFLAQSPSGGAPPFALLDGVSLTQTPEPATVWMLGGALLALSAGIRKSRSKKR
jgi:hypothetical protein